MARKFEHQRYRDDLLDAVKYGISPDMWGTPSKEKTFQKMYPNLCDEIPLSGTSVPCVLGESTPQQLELF